MFTRAQTQILKLLRWSETYFKTDMVYLASGGFWLAVGKFGASASSLLLAIAFANLIAPETYGVYKYVLSVIVILVLTTLPGIDLSFQRAVSQGREGGMRKTFLTRVRWGLLGSAGAFALAGYYFMQGNSNLAIAFAIAAVFVPIMDPLSLYDDLLLGRRAFSRSTAIFLTSQFAMTIVLIGTLFIAPTLFAILIAYLAGWSALRAFFLFLVTKHSPPNHNVDDSVSSYGKHLSIMKGAGTIASSLGGIFLFQTVSGNALATFSFAIAPIEQIRGWLGPIESLIFPKLSKESSSVSTIRGFFSKTALFFLLFACLIVVYILLAPVLFSTLFPQYLDSVPYSRIYAPTLIFSLYTLLLTIVLRARGEIRSLYVSSAWSIVVSLVCTPICTALWGIAGLIGSIYLLKVIECVIVSYLVFKSHILKSNNNLSSPGDAGMSENR